MAYTSGVFPLHINVNPNTQGFNLNISDVSPTKTGTLFIRAGNPYNDSLSLHALGQTELATRNLNIEGVNTPSGTITLYCAAPLSSGISNKLTLFAKVADASGTIVSSIPLYIQQNVSSGLKLRIKGGWSNAIGVSSFRSRDGYTPVDGTRILHIERTPADNNSIDMYISGDGAGGSMDLNLINNEEYLALNMSDVSPQQTTNMYISGGWMGNNFVPNVSGSLNMYIDI